MSWQQDANQLLRILIGDDDSPYTYCDDRLNNIIIGSAKMVLFELSFDNSYTVDMNALAITPDPVDDPYFIPLVCLYSASKIANSEYKQFALSSVNITDGPATIDMSGQATALLQRMKALQADYANAKLQYGIGTNPSLGAVLSGLRSVYSNCYSNGQFRPDYYSQHCFY